MDKRLNGTCLECCLVMDSNLIFCDREMAQSRSFTTDQHGAAKHLLKTVSLESDGVVQAKAAPDLRRNLFDERQVIAVQSIAEVIAAYRKDVGCALRYQCVR